MIDYLTHVAAFEAAVNALDANGGAPHQADWSATRTALDSRPGCARLGALLGHLLERSGPVDFEHERLSEAADLYGQAVDALDAARSLRTRWEGMVLDPASASLSAFQGFTGDGEQLKAKMEDLKNRVEAYQGTVQPPFKHVVEHGAAFDQPVSAWTWRDVTTSRRTNALVRALRVTGDGSAATRAFAFGAATGYAGNTSGSAFLAHTVGGPRRSHPIRDRVGRYSLGAWLREYEPGHTGTLGDLRGRLDMPAAVKQQILGALAATYPSGAPSAMPDLDTGFKRLLEHIELLDSFPRLAPPEDIPAVLLGRVQASPLASDVQNDPDDWNRPDHINRLPEPWPLPSTGNLCLDIVILIVLALAILTIIILKALGVTLPWEDEPPMDPAPGDTTEAMQAFLTSDYALLLVVGLHQIESALHELVTSGLYQLKRTGFLYPDQLDLYDPAFGQFAKVPSGVSAANFPRRPLPDPSVGYLLWPSSGMENPGRAPSPFTAGATPSALLHGAAGVPGLGATGAAAWHELFTPPTRETANLDQDADRGHRHGCWRVAPGGSVHNDPVPVQNLGYDAVA